METCFNDQNKAWFDHHTVTIHYMHRQVGSTLMSHQEQAPSFANINTSILGSLDWKKKWCWENFGRIITKFRLQRIFKREKLKATEKGGGKQRPSNPTTVMLKINIKNQREEKSALKGYYSDLTMRHFTQLDVFVDGSRERIISSKLWQRHTKISWHHKNYTEDNWIRKRCNILN